MRQGTKHVTKIFSEILLLVSVAMNAALLIFIAGVLRKVMNDMDNSTFTHFVRSLVLHSKWSPFMEITLNIPAVGAIPYFYFFGFENRWLTAGLALWLAAGLVSKMIKVPVYRMIETVGRGDEVDLRKLRRKLNVGNVFQASCNTIATAMIAISLVK